MDSQEPLNTQILSDSDCGDVRETFLRFLQDYQPSPPEEALSPGEVGQTRGFYVELIQEMISSGKVTLFVDFQHVDDYSSQLGDNIYYQHHRLDRYLRQALHTVVRELDTGYAEIEGRHREFFVGFTTQRSSGIHQKMRELRTESIGKLRSFTATVTRTSGVRPELFLGTFICSECGVENAQVEQHFRYTQPITCSNPACGNRTGFQLVREKSIFVDWQKVKVQELSDEIPAGSLPRTMEVILRADNVEKARAGDKVTFVGNSIVVPDVAAISAPGERVRMQPGRQGNANQEGITGMRNLGARELTYKLAFLACAIEASEARLGVVNVRADDMEGLSREEALAQFTPQQQAHILSMANNPSILRDLGRSIAPGVFGHDSVKRAVLLMLLGGVHKATAEGIHLRGDINVAIVGDPSCAKSQMLKYVAAFLPRAVYTSGKSSSAAGLTASVVKDSDSGEFCIEAGALMLADNGICCIDEFDKMDQKDQVAIHEAMEQQTISIAKAGIQATLNARTSILAAANPLGGRYDRAKPLRHNVALPPAILSRFDLLHVMIDEPDEYVDSAIAKHILAVHRQQARVLDVPYTLEQMQRYICFARSIRPQLTPEAKEELVQSYKKLRTEDAAPGSSTAYRITVRQLEALVRLSEAIARAASNPQILPEYVQEARRLMKASRIEVMSVEQELQDDEDGADADPDSMLRTVELYRQQQRQQQAAAGGGAAEEPPAGKALGPGPSPSSSNAANAGASGAGDVGAGEGDAGVPDPAAVAARLHQGPTRVPQAKIDQVKALLFQKLRDASLLGESTREVWGDQVAVMPQHKLLEAYFADQIDRGVYTSTSELEADIGLINKIVGHLLRHGELQEAYKPPQLPSESAAAYKRRCHKERELCISPNLNLELNL